MNSLGNPAATNVNWEEIPVGLASSGSRRLDASSFIAGGWGLFQKLISVGDECEPLGEMASVWQPHRLKGVTVESQAGRPFLAAGQLFELRPSFRKWLAPSKTPNLDQRLVARGQLLITCSGNVGRPMIAHGRHPEAIVTHDLLRVDPARSSVRGYLYAFLRTAGALSMMTSRQYGHVVKHLEVEHVLDLPVPRIASSDEELLERSVVSVFDKRESAHNLIVRAETRYAQALGLGGFVAPPTHRTSVSVSDVGYGRRRLEASYYSPVVEAIEAAAQERGLQVQPLSEIVDRVFMPNRFSRVATESGIVYRSAEEVFSINPPVTKRIFPPAGRVADECKVQPGWILVARSGQVYGMNGSTRLVDRRLAREFISEDMIRVVPDGSSDIVGFIAAVLGHPELGRPVLLREAYGTSIPHLDPEDVATVRIPRVGDEIERSISADYLAAVQLRSEADELEDRVTEFASDHLYALLGSERHRESLAPLRTALTAVT